MEPERSTIISMAMPWVTSLICSCPNCGRAKAMVRNTQETAANAVGNQRSRTRQVRGSIASGAMVATRRAGRRGLRHSRQAISRMGKSRARNAHGEAKRNISCEMRNEECQIWGTAKIFRLVRLVRLVWRCRWLGMIQERSAGGGDFVDFWGAWHLCGEFHQVTGGEEFL